MSTRSNHPLLFVGTMFAGAHNGQDIFGGLRTGSRRWMALTWRQRVMTKKPGRNHLAGPDVSGGRPFAAGHAPDSIITLRFTAFRSVAHIRSVIFKIGAREF
jgi:hypothetical protein